jgi:two-component sensor histidine kinase/CheY-like chemotaxis protein/putative methionine-R-sulfoxide reductase with GAF domain
MAKIMIAEDDLLMADMLEDVLVGGGHDVCGIARTVDEAVELGKHHQPDLAILDIRLAEGGLGTDIPPRLKNGRHMGILYASGHAGQMGLTKANGDALITKPYRPQDVLRAVKIVEQIVQTGEASGPFPARFYLLNGSPGNLAPLQSASEGAEIVRLRRQQGLLAKFGSYAFTETDIHSVLTEAARICAEGLGVPFCKICRYRSDENDLLIEAGVGWHEGVVGQVVSRADTTSPQGRAFLTREPVICDDLSKEASFILPRFYGTHKIISTIDVVIQSNGKPYGVLEIDSPVAQTYDQHDIDFLTGFANVLAGAVEAAKRRSIAAAQAHDKDRLLETQMALVETQRALLDEKTILARELNHRVRNNLQLVYGMLDRQLHLSKDKDESRGISAIARRIMALAQIYEHLLGIGLSHAIDFGEYLSSLCPSLAAVEMGQHPNVKITCHCDCFIVDLDTTTSLGLIVTELIANSFEHAYPDGTGTIRVSLIADPQGEYATLSVSDDGAGFIDDGSSKRHGLALVKRLVEQIKGSLTLDSAHGTKWILTVPAPRSRSVPVSNSIH